MKIIQSFWSKPLFEANKDASQNRYNGGWINYRYCLLSMAYSCLTISRYYPNLELYTDTFGMNLFRDILRLPYHKFHVNLDDIANIDTSLWAYGKIMTYSAQKEPFLHIDNDVFIWQNFPDRIIDAEVVCQSLEMIDNFSLTDYTSAVDYIKKHIGAAPQIIIDSKCKTAANMGIFGGNNLDFIQQYCKESRAFLTGIYDGIMQSGDMKGKFNVVYEQLLLTELANKHQQKISYLIPNNDIDEIVKYSTIETAQYESKYAHCLGRLKKYNYICEQIEYRLKYEFPTYYNRIISYLNKNQIIYAENIKSMNDYDNFYKIYTRINVAKNISEIMTNFEFKLKSNCHIEAIDDSYYMNSPQGRYKLTGWCIFLTLFSLPNTGNSICMEIFKEGYLPNLTSTQIHDNIFYLIMESLYITKCLTIS